MDFWTRAIIGDRNDGYLNWERASTRAVISIGFANRLAAAASSWLSSMSFVPVPHRERVRLTVGNGSIDNLTRAPGDAIESRSCRTVYDRAGGSVGFPPSGR